MREHGKQVENAWHRRRVRRHLIVTILELPSPGTEPGLNYIPRLGHIADACCRFEE